MPWVNWYLRQCHRNLVRFYYCETASDLGWEVACSNSFTILSDLRVQNGKLFSRIKAHIFFIPFRLGHFIHLHDVHFDTIKVLLPTDAQLNCLKNEFKIYIKIDVKTAATCFGVITIIRERTI